MFYSFTNFPLKHELCEGENKTVELNCVCQSKVNKNICATSNVVSIGVFMWTVPLIL